MSFLYDEEASFEEVVEGYQHLIDTGAAWRLEGSVGRQAMRFIEEGYCTVGPFPVKDYWGNTVPGVFQLEPGAMGTPGYVEKMALNR